MRFAQLSFMLLCAAAELASAQPAATAASGPKTRAEVKNEVKAARANRELPPDANRDEVGDPPVPARKPKAPRKSASSAM